jgi:hypothetical protein
MLFFFSFFLGVDILAVKFWMNQLQIYPLYEAAQRQDFIYKFSERGGLEGVS